MQCLPVVLENMSNGANVFNIVLGSDGNKQGTQYNKRGCILDQFHSPLFRLMMATEHIQCEGIAKQPNPTLFCYSLTLHSRD